MSYYISAKTALLIGTTTPNIPLYTEEAINPSPEFNEIVNNPQSLEGGNEETFIFDDWASQKPTISTPLSASLDLIRELLTASNFKSTSWSESEADYINYDTTLTDSSGAEGVSVTTTLTTITTTFKKKTFGATAKQMYVNIEATEVLIEFMSEYLGDSFIVIYNGKIYEDSFREIAQVDIETLTGRTLRTGYEYKMTLSERTDIVLDIVTARITFHCNGVKAKSQFEGTVGDKITSKFEVMACQKPKRDGGIETKLSTDSDFTLPLPATPNLAVLKRIKAVTLNGNEIGIEKFSLNCNQEIEEVKLTNDHKYFTNEFKPELTLTTKLTPETVNGFDEVLAGSEFKIIMDIYTLDDKLVWQIVIPRAKISKNEMNANKIWEATKTYKMLATNGGDNFTLRYINQ